MNFRIQSRLFTWPVKMVTQKQLIENQKRRFMLNVGSSVILGQSLVVLGHAKRFLEVHLFEMQHFENDQFYDQGSTWACKIFFWKCTFSKCSILKMTNIMIHCGSSDSIFSKHQLSSPPEQPRVAKEREEPTEFEFLGFRCDHDVLRAVEAKNRSKTAKFCQKCPFLSDFWLLALLKLHGCT